MTSPDDEEAWDAYHDRIKALWERAGCPTSRNVAAQTRKVSHGTANNVIYGHRLPTATVLIDVTRALGASEQEVTELLQLRDQARGEGRSGAPVTARSFALDRAVLGELVAIRKLLEERLPVHEIPCPECNAVIRARMADK